VRLEAPGSYIFIYSRVPMPEGSKRSRGLF